MFNFIGKPLTLTAINKKIHSTVGISSPRKLRKENDSSGTVKTGPLPQYGSFIARIFSEYFLDIAVNTSIQ